VAVGICRELDSWFHHETPPETACPSITGVLNQSENRVLSHMARCGAERHPVRAVAYALAGHRGIRREIAAIFLARVRVLRVQNRGQLVDAVTGEQVAREDKGQGRTAPSAYGRCPRREFLTRPAGELLQP
jgi:hypothetical protein